MPVIKYYEDVDNLNKLEVTYLERETEHFLSITITHEEGNQIEINLTRMDLLNLIKELEIINDIIYEKEGGKNG